MRYTYNRITNEFIKEVDTDSKLAFSTDIEPEIPEDHKAFFIDQEWEYVEIFEYTYKVDEDGFISIDGSIDIETNEECPDEECYKYVDDSWVLDLDKELCKSQVEMKLLVDEKYDSIIADGYINNGNKYNYDNETLAIIAARLAHCNSTTNLGDAELVFYNSDKESITFADKASIVQFFEDFITSRNHIDQNKLSLKAQVKACATKEEVEAIDITVGW